MTSYCNKISHSMSHCLFFSLSHSFYIYLSLSSFLSLNLPKKRIFLRKPQIHWSSILSFLNNQWPLKIHYLSYQAHVNVTTNMLSKKPIYRTRHLLNSGLLFNCRFNHWHLINNAIKLALCLNRKWRYIQIMLFCNGI